jgi:hypothetical protein
MKVSVSLGVILLPLVFSALAKPKPFFQERRLIDRIVESSRSEGRRDSALRNLERLADGEIPRFDAAAREELGFSATTLSGMAYRMPSVRAYALRAVGLVGGDDAIKFLSAKTKSDFDQAGLQELWPAVQVSIENVRLGQLSSQQAIEVYLQTTLTNSSGAVANWAVEEVCDRGLESSLPFVQESIRRMNAGPRSEADIRFCEERVAVLSGSASRVMALSRFLTTSAIHSDPRLVRWAMTLLTS